MGIMQNDDSDVHDRLVGGRIRDARRAHGLTQEDLARAVGVSRSAVAQWETGRAGQLRGNLARIASVLGMPVAALMEGVLEERESGGGGLAEGTARDGTEIALLRLFRACPAEDRALLLRTAHRLARAEESAGVTKLCAPGAPEGGSGGDSASGGG